MARRRAQLTDTLITSLTCRSGSPRKRVWDTKLYGLLVEVSAQHKRFVVRYRGQYRTLGSTPPLTAKEARVMAFSVVREIESLSSKPADFPLLAPAKPPAPLAKETHHPPLKAIVTEYLGVKKVKHSTAQGYWYCLRKYWPDFLEQPLTALSGDAVMLRFREISAPSAGNHSLRIIRALFRFYNAAHDKALQVPTAKVLALEGAHRLSPKTRLILDSQQRDWYVNVMAHAGPTARDLFILIACTGLRVNEARTLEKQSIDPRDKVLHVMDTKNGKPLTLPYGRRIQRLLEARIAPLKEPSSPLFSINERNVRKMLHRVVEASGIEWSSHDLRRGLVSMATRLGVPDRLVKRLVNHAESDVTGRHYIHISPDALRPHIQAVEDALWALWFPEKTTEGGPEKPP